MKRLAAYLLLIPLLWACTSQDSIYREYYERAYPVNYPQKATHLSGVPGYLKARLSWDAPVSPTCKEAVIYWNNKSDSLRINLQDPAFHSQTGIQVDITGLQESDYTFDVYVLDREGSRSLPSQVLVSPKGANYIAGLNGRDVITASISEINNAAVVRWTKMSKHSPFSEFRYLDSQAQQKTIQVEPSVDQLLIDDLNQGSDRYYEYRSVFVTAECMDTLYTDWKRGEWFVDPDYAQAVSDDIECLSFRLRKGAVLHQDSSNPYQYTIECTTTAPSVYVNELAQPIKGPVLVFQYKQTLQSGDAKVLWADAGGSYSGQRYSMLAFSGLTYGDVGWNVAVIDMSEMISEAKWEGKAGDWSIINLDTSLGNVITIRNAHFRAKREGE